MPLLQENLHGLIQKHASRKPVDAVPLIKMLDLLAKKGSSYATHLGLETHGRKPQVTRTLKALEEQPREIKICFCPFANPKR